MFTFTVRLSVIAEDVQNVETVTVDAEYYNEGDDFVTFKDAEHKQIASFNARNVLSITRAERKANIGTVVVNVAPDLDEEAMQRLVDEVAKRARRATSGAKR